MWIERIGWRRVDPRPWRSKCDARWLHRRGWRLEHCGHPTALYPWALYSLEGALILAGIAGPHRRADFGHAFAALDDAVQAVALIEAAGGLVAWCAGAKALDGEG